MTIRRTWNTYLKLQENFRKSLKKSETYISIVFWSPSNDDLVWSNKKNKTMHTQHLQTLQHVYPPNQLRMNEVGMDGVSSSSTLFRYSETPSLLYFMSSANI